MVDVNVMRRWLHAGLEATLAKDGGHLVQQGLRDMGLAALMQMAHFNARMKQRHSIQPCKGTCGRNWGTTVAKPITP